MAENTQTDHELGGLLMAGVLGLHHAGAALILAARRGQADAPETTPKASSNNGADRHPKRTAMNRIRMTKRRLEENGINRCPTRRTRTGTALFGVRHRGERAFIVRRRAD